VQAQFGTWKNGFRLVEFFTERRDGARAMRRTLRRQDDSQFT
jgi:hypothetical protein